METIDEILLSEIKEKGLIDIKIKKEINKDISDEDKELSEGAISLGIGVGDYFFDEIK